ncbi:MAG TPA: long-chain fatty acid--CoA ligase [Stellaceae bacterium]|nr:long-chain fatty acid--CoA ligase [Stellaceae bacterium]
MTLIEERAPAFLAHYPPEVAWDEAFPVVSAPAAFAASIARFADRPCLDFLDRKYSYAEVGVLVDRAALGLQELGIGKGSKVGLFLPNCPYAVIFFWAVLRVGATVVNYNPLYAAPEIRKQIIDSGTELMVTLDLTAIYPRLAGMLDGTPLKRIVVCRMADALPFPTNLLFPLLKRSLIAAIPDDDRHLSFARLTRHTGRPAPVEIDPLTDVAVLQYTGGTTGVPKGAMLTHHNIIVNARQCLRWNVGVEPGTERVLAVLPLFHVFALTVAGTLAIMAGAEIILLPRFEIDQVLETIRRKRPTMLPGVPTVYTAIINHPKIDRYDLTSINRCMSGGAPMPVEVKASFERLTGCTVVEGYGLTETAPVAACNPLIGVNKAGSIGIPLPGTTIEVVSLDDPDRLVAQGERGEICISGPQVMLGYWHQPDETARVLRNGRLHTGDVGYIDEDGYVFLVDRIKDLILAGGFNVYPRNVEEAIYQHPDVAECIVVGVPDPYRGQTVKAYVACRQGSDLTEAALKAFLKDKLSPIELPKSVEFRDSLPKTLVGKLSKKMLLDEERAKAPTA